MLISDSVGNVPVLNFEYTSLSFKVTSKAPDLGGVELPFMDALG